MFGIGTPELVIFGIIAVILFGSRLPSVARSMGKSIVEFKKGMKDIENDVTTSVYSEPAGLFGYSDHSEPAAPRLEPPTTDAEEREERLQGSGTAS